MNKKSLDITNFEQFIRPVYEWRMAGTWFVSALIMALVYMFTWKTFPRAPFLICAGWCTVLGAYRAYQANKLSAAHKRLGDGGLQFIKWSEFKKKANSAGRAFLGDGFVWGQRALEVSNEIQRIGPENIVPPDKLKKGNYWIHGLGAKIEDIGMPFELLSGHTLVVGTTGSGKTRLLDILVSQAILRGDAVFIIDPKGDHELRMNAMRSCELAGDPSRFVMFHPAYPEESYCIDPLKNWNRPTELASRIAALVPAEGGGDPFQAFAWNAINTIVQALLRVSETPTLKQIRHYIEEEPGPLVARVLRTHLANRLPGWELIAAKKSGGGGGGRKNSEVDVLIEIYAGTPEIADTDIGGLINLYKHDRTHFSKMITSLIPILNMLTTGTVGNLLTPEARDSARKETDTAKIVAHGQVAYIGLDSLSDPTVGSAIGSILLADLAAVAGDRYNYGVGDRPVSVFVDEAAEVLNAPTIQILNKGRGAKFQMTICTQTLADFVVRTGSQDAARQVLANANNLIVLRVLDGETQKYISENLPTTQVRKLTTDFRTGGKTSTDEWSNMTGERMETEEVPLFPPSLLGQLPNLHFFAKFANASLYKGRLPILVPDDFEMPSTK